MTTNMISEATHTGLHIKNAVGHYERNEIFDNGKFGVVLEGTSCSPVMASNSVCSPHDTGAWNEINGGSISHKNNMIRNNTVPRNRKGDDTATFLGVTAAIPGAVSAASNNPQTPAPPQPATTTTTTATATTTSTASAPSSSSGVAEITRDLARERRAFVRRTMARCRDTISLFNDVCNGAGPEKVRKSVQLCDDGTARVSALPDQSSIFELVAATSIGAAAIFHTNSVTSRPDSGHHHKKKSYEAIPTLPAIYATFFENPWAFTMDLTVLPADDYKWATEHAVATFEGTVSMSFLGATVLSAMPPPTTASNTSFRRGSTGAVLAATTMLSKVKAKRRASFANTANGNNNNDNNTETLTESDKKEKSSSSASVSRTNSMGSTSKGGTTTPRLPASGGGVKDSSSKPPSRRGSAVKSNNNHSTATNHTASSSTSSTTTRRRRSSVKLPDIEKKS
eukprot:PhM_4_TR18724/c1_g1_i2/m.73290